MTSQPGLQAIALHILTNISQLKGSQRMKYYQEKHFPSKIMQKMRHRD